MKHFTLTKKHRQKGVTLPLLALFIFTLFIIAALAVDMGILYTSRTSAQHAADAAALAGAFTFQNAGVTQPDAAYNAAVTVANRNKVLGQPVLITQPVFTTCPSDTTTSWVCVEWNAIPSLSKYRVTVNAARTGTSGITTYFARVFGITSADVATKATAERATGSGTSCLKPLFVGNSAIGPDTGPNNCTNSQTFFANNCRGDSCPPTVYAVGPGYPSQAGGMLGQQFDTWSSAGVPSQWGELNLTGSVGGATGPTLRCTIENCLNACPGVTQTVACGAQLQTKTGGTVGNIGSPVKTLIGFPSNDAWPGLSSLNLSSPSLITVGVYQDCSQACIGGPAACQTGQNVGFGPVTPGTQPIIIIGYVQYFVDTVVNTGNPKYIRAHLVNVSECGVAGGPTGPSNIPIRLIQPGET